MAKAQAKVAQSGIKALLKRLGPKALAGLGLGGSGIGTALMALLYLPLLLQLGGKGLKALRGTEMGESLLGATSEKKRETLEALATQLQGKEDLAGTLETQMLQRRETQREALLAAPAGLEATLMARSAGRVARGIREGGAASTEGLLTPDEREKARNVVMQAGLPREF